MPQDAYSLRLASANNRERYGLHPGLFTLMDSTGQKLGRSIYIHNDSEALDVLKALRDAGVNLPRGKNTVYWTKEPRKVQILNAKQELVYVLMNLAK